MVLLTACKNLQEPAHLEVATDDRIDISFLGAGGKIVREAGGDLGVDGRRAASTARGRRHVAWDALQGLHVRPKRAWPESEGLQNDGGTHLSDSPSQTWSGSENR